MKMLRNKLSTFMTTALCSTLLFSGSAMAATNSSEASLNVIIKQLNAIGTGLSDHMLYNIIPFWGWLYFTPSPGLGEQIKSNVLQIDAQKKAQVNANAETTAAIKRTLFTTNATSDLNASSTQVPTNQTQANVQASKFNINQILNNPNMSEAKIQEARNYIKFVSGQASPFQTLPSSILRQKTGPVKEYLTALGQYAATQSVGLSDLFHLINERKVVPGLGTLAGVKNLKGEAVPNASPLQVDKFNATKRLVSSSWYAKMETANSTTLQRETLYLMAEMRYAQYQQRMEMQRLNATLAVMELQMAKHDQQDNLQSLQQAALQSVSHNSSAGG